MNATNREAVDYKQGKITSISTRIGLYGFNDSWCIGVDIQKGMKAYQGDGQKLKFAEVSKISHAH